MIRVSKPLAVQFWLAGPPASPRLLSRNHLLTLRLQHQVKLQERHRAGLRLSESGASGEGSEAKHPHRLRGERDWGRPRARRGAPPAPPPPPRPGPPQPGCRARQQAECRGGAGAGAEAPRGRGGPASPRGHRRPAAGQGKHSASAPATGWVGASDPKSDRGRTDRSRVILQPRGVPCTNQSTKRYP